MWLTMHDREFYLVKAEEYPLLEDAIAGTATFTQHLEGIVEKLHRGKESMAEGKKSRNALKDYITALSALLPNFSPGNEELKKMDYTALTMGLHTFFRRATLSSGIVTGLGALLLIALNPVGGALALLGAGGGALWGSGLFESRKYNREARQIFQCLYDASAALDSDIGLCFALEHYRNARPRFEQTYRTLPGEKRAAVDGRLLCYLAAGGIPGMDEQQLDDYLTGLLEQDQEGDA